MGQTLHTRSRGVRRRSQSRISGGGFSRGKQGHIRQLRHQPGGAQLTDTRDREKQFSICFEIRMAPDMGVDLLEEGVNLALQKDEALFEGGLYLLQHTGFGETVL